MEKENRIRVLFVELVVREIVLKLVCDTKADEVLIVSKD